MMLSRQRREELTVFVSGATVMGIEILAGRMLAPQFGSSIYTWGSIIGVFMAALSLGYYYGGKRAERRASFESLRSILLGAAVYVAFLIVAGEFMLQQAALLPVPARYAAIPPVVILFGPSTFLLGFISPYVAQLSEKRSTGEASGHVFAVGTVGSIAGAFLTTFALIPYLSVQQIQLLFGGLLVAGAVVATTHPKRLLRPLGYAGSVAMILVAAVVVQTYGLGVQDVVHQTQTPYQELTVKDKGDMRTMYLNGQPQSAMFLNGSDAHVFRYTKYFSLPFLMADDTDDIDKVLFIGGGGFTGPKQFVDDYNATVDVVEIDPAVVNAAETYFNVSESSKMDIHTMDGRTYLQETDETYDLIVLDAYKKSSVPFHLTTKEFMQLAHSRLTADGIMYANLISAPSGPGSEFYRSEYRTMQSVFPTVYSFHTSTSPFTQNIELIATKDAERLSQEELQRRNQERAIGINLSEEIALYQENVDTDGAQILTDDRAPVDKLLDPLIGSKYVIEGASGSTHQRN